MNVYEFLEELKDPEVGAIKYHFSFSGVCCSHRACFCDGKILDTDIDDEEFELTEQEFIEDYDDYEFYIDEIIPMEE